MKNVFLTFALLLTVSFAFAANDIKEPLSFELIEVDLIKMDTNNNIKNIIINQVEVIGDCFGYAISHLEEMESNYGSIGDGEGARLMNYYYAYCELFL